MDKLVKRLELLTQQVVKNLSDVSFEEINAFVAEREVIMTELQTNSFTPEELDRNRDTMKRIIEQDSIILARMNELKDEAAAQMSKISTGRTQKNAYDASYSSDGIYLDKKK